MAVRSGRRSSKRQSILAVALAAGAFAAIFAAPPAAQSQGLFDFLFGGPERRPAPPPAASSYADPYSTPAPERPRYGGGGGGGSGGMGGGIGARSVSYCVRLCDGQHFPIQKMANATPVEICRQMCPTSKTKIFYGSVIDHAVASDGTRYANLDNAFTYRDKMVPNCTCNGKDAFGLTHMDVTMDPTLRPGDIVSTGNGLMAYNGKRGRQTAEEFTPVDSSVPLAELAHKSTKTRLSRRGSDESSEQADQPEPTERPQRREPAPTPDLRGQVVR
jgi:hypothetical protein